MSRRERTADPVEHERARSQDVGGLFAMIANGQDTDEVVYVTDGYSQRVIDRPAVRLDDPDWLLRPMTPLEHRFRDFHHQRPQVYAALEAAALARLQGGATRIGIADLAEDLRKTQPAKDGARYAVNNSFRAFFAKLMVHRHPELADLIEIRVRRERGAA